MGENHLTVPQKVKEGVPVVVQQLANLTSLHEDMGSIPGLTQWVKDLALPWAVVQVADTSLL